MSPLLEQKHKYIVFESVHSVRTHLKSTIRTPWYDIAINIAGKVSDDNSFKLYSRLSLGVKAFNIPQHIAILTGKLEPQGEQQTIIHVEVRANYAVLFALYLILVIFVFKLISSFNSSTSQDWFVTALLFFLLIFLRSLIHFSIGRLKNRFERVMSVKPEE